MKQNITRPKFVESICTTEPELKNSCLDGLVSYYLVHVSSATKTREMCAELDGDNQATCFNSIESRKAEFPL